MRNYHITEVTLVLAILALLPTACEAGLRHTSGIDSLVMELYADRSRARVDEPIQIRFTITNRGQRHIVVESPTTPVMDIVILGVGDQVLASWSSKNPEKISHRLEWKPGESKVLEWVWIPTQADYEAGAYYLPWRRVYASGRLYTNSKLVQSAGFDLCFDTRC
jgi:hypothetical protein